MNKLLITLLFTLLLASCGKKEEPCICIDDFVDGVNIYIRNPITKDKKGYLVNIFVVCATIDGQKEMFPNYEEVWFSTATWIFSEDWKKCRLKHYTYYDKNMDMIHSDDLNESEFGFEIIEDGSICKRISDSARTSSFYDSEDTDENMVYICNGPHSKRYHCDECCDGLSKCSSEVECISLNEAEGMGRTPCSRCY